MKMTLELEYDGDVEIKLDGQVCIPARCSKNAGSGENVAFRLTRE